MSGTTMRMNGEKHRELARVVADLVRGDTMDSALAFIRRETETDGDRLAVVALAVADLGGMRRGEFAAYLSEAGRRTADRAIGAARHAGETTGMVENEVGALRDLLRSALGMMSPKAQEIWEERDDVKAILSRGLPA